MSARQKGSRKRQPASPNGTELGTESPAAPPPQRSSSSSTIDSAYGECIGAICLVEVTLHSLEFQESASPEREVLKRALKAMWAVHDWMIELTPDSPNEDHTGEDES